MDDIDFKAALLKRLDTIIYLLIAPLGASDDVSLTEKVHRLIDHGLTSGETAKILGKPITTVSGIVSKRKAKNKPGKNK